LAALALALFLLAPDINGPLLVLVWLAIITAYRVVVAMMAEPRALATVDLAFILLALLAGFWGGWFLIPAGIAWLVCDLRDRRTGAPPVRIPGAEAVTGVAGAVLGWVALTIVVSDRLAAASRVSIADTAEGPTVTLGSADDLAAAGLASDQPTVVITLAGLLLGLMLVGAFAHERTGQPWLHILLGVTLIWLVAIAFAAGLSIGMSLLPAVAGGLIAWLLGWRYRGARR
jgi:hypothetical protein